MKKIKRALISVSNKQNLKKLLSTLKKYNVEIISSKANNVKSLGKSEDLYRVADRLYEHEREDKNIELGESLKDMRYRLHGY